jgi:hypothetical protein
MKWRASVAACAVSPLLKAGWPQQVCACGTSTRQPASRSSLSAAKPTLGRIASTRQVANSATCGETGRESERESERETLGGAFMGVFLQVVRAIVRGRSAHRKGARPRQHRLLATSDRIRLFFVVRRGFGTGLRANPEGPRRHACKAVATSSGGWFLHVRLAFGTLLRRSSRALFHPETT